MAITQWAAGTLTQPGDIVRPTNQGAVEQDTLDNPSFEAGNTGWSWVGSGGTVGISQTAPTFDGSWRAFASLQSGARQLVNAARIPCVPGDVVSCRAFLQATFVGGDPRYSYATLRIQWYNSSLSPIAASYAYAGNPLAGGEGIMGASAIGVWVPATIDAVAPAGAAYWTFAIDLYWPDDEPVEWSIDACSQSFASQDAPNNLLFRAVQSESGFTGNVEPDWPTVIGQTVVDNDVTWEAVSGSSITWQAHRILVSGSSEPTFPTTPSGSVLDNTIVWTLDTRQVTDEKLPSSRVVAKAASKIFAADDDIIRFSATVNPLDWQTPNDAGYIGFGLQSYGSQPVTGVGLYRGNLAAFNAEGCQIWQVDEDPAAITFLDAVPLPCEYPKTIQPVGDDLACLSSVGLRSLGTAGASVNLAASYFGEQVDELVLEALAAAIEAGYEPRALYWPAQGQYWCFFEDQAFVLTVHRDSGSKERRSWARYTFPWSIDYWTIMEGALYLRAGDLVLEVSADALMDDQYQSSGQDVGIEFTSVVQWPFLDFGNFNADKELLGFDLTITGTVDVSIGYDQRNLEYSQATGATWTEPYEVVGDTVPGQLLGFSVTGPSFSLRLEFAGNQAWRWYASTLYLKDTEGP